MADGPINHGTWLAERGAALNVRIDEALRSLADLFAQRSNADRARRYDAGSIDLRRLEIACSFDGDDIP